MWWHIGGVWLFLVCCWLYIWRLNMLYKIHCQSCSSTYFFESCDSGTPEACGYCGDRDYIIREPVTVSQVDAFVKENCETIMREKLKKVSFEVRNGFSLAALIAAFGGEIEVKSLVSHPGEDVWRVTVLVEDI